MRLRIAIGAVGVLLGLFGVFRLLTQVPNSDLKSLLIWLVAAVVLHDGVLSPIIAGLGWGISKVVPPRPRRYLEPALIAGAAITVIALPMIHRENTQPASKAILQQNFGAHLAVVLGIVAAVAVVAYVVGIVRERPQPVAAHPRPGPGRARQAGPQRPSATNERPSDDHPSSAE